MRKRYYCFGDNFAGAAAAAGRGGGGSDDDDSLSLLCYVIHKNWSATRFIRLLSLLTENPILQLRRKIEPPPLRVWQMV